MALFAIGDLHLSFSSARHMEEFDPIWKNHHIKLAESFKENITDSDTVLLTGDHTWGGHLSTCMPELEWICNLPGRKILLRGNHDIFWQVKGTKKLQATFEGRLNFLQNGYEVYEEYAIVGSKGYCYEPWDWHDKAKQRAKKRYLREVERLRTGFEAACEAGYSRFIMALHYPPTEIADSGNEYGGYPDSCFTRLAKEYGCEMVVYSHLHGKERFADSLTGMHDGIMYQLVSADYLNFSPMKLM